MPKLNLGEYRKNMNKTRKIKEIIGGVIEKKGFRYIRCEKKVVFDFKRQVHDVEQHVYVQQHNIVDQEYKIMLYTTAKGHGMKEIGNILPEYESKEYWKAETDEEFISLMYFFASFLQNYGLDELDKMLVEKPDSFETPERKEWFKEHWQELFEKYEGIYHVMEEDSTKERIKRIDQILYDNRKLEDEESGKKVQELWLGMAAIVTEMALQIPNAKIFYDTYHIEIHIIEKNTFCTIRPIYNVFQAWIRYHNDTFPSRDFLNRRVYSYLEKYI